MSVLHLYTLPRAESSTNYRDHAIILEAKPGLDAKPLPSSQLSNSSAHSQVVRLPCRVAKVSANDGLQSLVNLSFIKAEPIFLSLIHLI